tara:strand:- start:242 stop:715 length:474 start_codon:yes stop_codon:yes gene_type:complete
MKSWRQRNPERVAETDFKYNNSERGFIINAVTNIFKPSKGKTRKKRWRPQITKKQIWEEFFLHVQFMKDLYPQSDGRLCRYCLQPWTYLTRKKRPGTLTPKKRGPSHPTNFAIDRFNAKFTYLLGNIIFCCAACNDRKRDSTPRDWKNFIRVLNEKT